MSASPVETSDVEKLRELMRATYQEHEQILDEIEIVESQIVDLEKENNEREISQRERELKTERNENEIKFKYQEIKMREENIVKQKETYKLLLSQNEMLSKKLQEMDRNSERSRLLWQERLEKLEKDTQTYLSTLESFPWYQEKKAAVDERERQRKIQEDLEQKIKETKEESERLQKQINDGLSLPWVKFCSKLAKVWLEYDDLTQEVENERKILNDKEQQLIKDIEQAQEEYDQKKRREAEDKGEAPQIMAGAGAEREPGPVFKIPVEIPEHSKTLKAKDCHYSKDVSFDQEIANKQLERQDKRAIDDLMSGKLPTTHEPMSKKAKETTEAEPDLDESVCSQLSSMTTGSLMGMAGEESPTPDPQPIGDYPPIVSLSHSQPSQASNIGASISQLPPAAISIQECADLNMSDTDDELYRPCSRSSTFSETSQSSVSSVLSTASRTRKQSSGFNLQRASMALGMTMATAAVESQSSVTTAGTREHPSSKDPKTSVMKTPVHSILSNRDDQGQSGKKNQHQKTVAFAPTPQRSPEPDTSFSTEPQAKTAATQKTVSTIDTGMFTTTGTDQGGSDQRMRTTTGSSVLLPNQSTMLSAVPKKSAAGSQDSDEDNFLTIFGPGDQDSDEDDEGRTSSRGFSFNFAFNKTGTMAFGGEKEERAKEIEIAKKRIQGLANPFDFDDENPFA